MTSNLHLRRYFTTLNPFNKRVSLLDKPIKHIFIQTATIVTKVSYGSGRS